MHQGKKYSGMTPTYRHDTMLSDMVNGQRKLKVLCVLKSGGDFDGAYVKVLREAVARHTNIPYSFCCLTDVHGEIDCSSIALEDDLPGWWSKIELFRIPGPVVYFDLDTTIVGNLDPLFSAVLAARQRMFMLNCFNPRNLYGRYASGVMGWNGDFRFVYDDFNLNHMHMYRGDQFYIATALSTRDIEPDYIQSQIKGIYSFKRHCQDGVPDDASIVCFHGKPRPRDLGLIP